MPIDKHEIYKQYHHLKRLDLLSRCRYLKDDTPEAELSISWCALENRWLEMCREGGWQELKDLIINYVKAGYARFQPADGTPAGIKAVLYDEYLKNSEGMPFLIWYCSYTGEKKATPFIPQPPKGKAVWTEYDWLAEQELISRCRYYGGEKDSPFSDQEMDSYWFYESAWVRENIQHNYDFLNENLMGYLYHGHYPCGIGDKTPVTLKALLWSRYDHWMSDFMDGGFEQYYQTYLDKAPIHKHSV